jgi:shikimate dehydrogenase
MVYNPPETAFLKAGKRHGAAGINGRAMLEGQAEAAWRIWLEELDLKL